MSRADALAAGNEGVRVSPMPMTSLSQPSRDDAISLMRGGLAKAMMETAASYVMPISWITGRDGKPSILDSGSAFLLDCGGGPFVVTANHVYRGFCAAKEEYSDAVCILGDVRFDLVARHIASDPVYDVATFRIAADEVDKLANYANGKIILTGSQRSWPPSPPQVDRGVFFVGFPGDGREMRPYQGNSLVEIDWVGYTALAVASGVSDAAITLVFDHEHDFDVGLRPVIPSDWALGGCSGAPLLTFVEQNGIFSWRLGGIIYESSRLILKASRADCLNPDGSLNPYPNPMAYRRTR
jgi:hypothetical protein